MSLVYVCPKRPQRTPQEDREALANLVDDAAAADEEGKRGDPELVGQRGQHQEAVQVERERREHQFSCCVALLLRNKHGRASRESTVLHAPMCSIARYVQYCTLCTVLHAMYSISRPLCTVFHAPHVQYCTPPMYSIARPLCTVLHAPYVQYCTPPMYSIARPLCTVLHAPLYSIARPLCTVLHAPYVQYCTPPMYSIARPLCTVLHAPMYSIARPLCTVLHAPYVQYCTFPMYSISRPYVQYSGPTWQIRFYCFCNSVGNTVSHCLCRVPQPSSSHQAQQLSLAQRPGCLISLSLSEAWADQGAKNPIPGRTRDRERERRKENAFDAGRTRERKSNSKMGGPGIERERRKENAFDAGRTRSEKSNSKMGGPGIERERRKKMLLTLGGPGSEKSNSKWADQGSRERRKENAFDWADQSEKSIPKWADQGSNQGPSDLQSDALPTELTTHDR